MAFNLLGIAASHRTDSVNRRLLALAADEAAIHGASVTAVEYATLDMPVYDDARCEREGVLPQAQKLAQRIAAHDGLVLCVPEYNWSYPGSLKNIIDWLSRLKPCPLKGKTALLLSASPSPRGGLTGLLHLNVVLQALDMFVYPKYTAIGDVHRALPRDGALESEKHRALLAENVAGFVAFTRCLRVRRSLGEGGSANL